MAGGGGVHERGDALQRVSRSRLAAPSNSPFVGDYARAKAKSTDAPMIARTAELQIVVQQFDDARAALQSILARHQGYAAQLNVANMDNSARTLNASLRVPSQELSSALNELKSLGHVAHEAQSGEEVTAEHADLLARLKNSRETETRLQDILRNRTGKVSDVLEVEEEIARVRGEIEQMESERKTLDRRVDFATINVAITEEFKAKVGDSTPARGHAISQRRHRWLQKRYRVGAGPVAVVRGVSSANPLLVATPGRSCRVALAPHPARPRHRSLNQVKNRTLRISGCGS